MNEVQARIKQLKLEFKVEVGADHYLQSDRIRITQIINTLVGNAIKFTRSGVISVRVKPVESDGQKLFYISVKDTGNGMD